MSSLALSKRAQGSQIISEELGAYLEPPFSTIKTILEMGFTLHVSKVCHSGNENILKLDCGDGYTSQST